VMIGNNIGKANLKRCGKLELRALEVVQPQAMRDAMHFGALHGCAVTQVSAAIEWLQRRSSQVYRQIVLPFCLYSHGNLRQPSGGSALPLIVPHFSKLLWSL
jgi:hypothetical protein